MRNGESYKQALWTIAGIVIIGIIAIILFTDVEAAVRKDTPIQEVQKEPDFPPVMCTTKFVFFKDSKTGSGAILRKSEVVAIHQVEAAMFMVITRQRNAYLITGNELNMFMECVSNGD